MGKRCLGCMDYFEEDFETCPNCGCASDLSAEEPVHLKPGTRLHSRYLMGKALGYGGFGVTYIAWDEKLETKVAIKEYLPSEFSTRIPGKKEVTIFSGDKSEQFEDGLKKFVDEAMKLAKFQNQSGIAKIYDTFEENSTAYMVMEYLEGQTLTDYLKEHETIPEDEAIKMLEPVMESLKVVHEEGILHRDIAPDNIFLTKDGEAKLIDFGASRYATTSHSRSLTVIIKPGFSPEEQYRSRGDQGKHSDVYALSATLYRMITGKNPPDAMERRAKYETKNKDILVEPHKLTKDITRAHEVAILNALNVRIEDRTPDVSEFMKELYADPPAKRRYGKIKKIDVYAWPLWVKILIPTLLVAMVTFGILIFIGVIDFSKYSKEMVIPDSIIIAPDVEGMRTEEALETVKKASLNATINGNIESDYISPGKIMTQTPVGGAFVERNGTVYLMVSSGNGVVEPYNGMSTVPYLVGDTREAAISKCKKAGLGEATFEEVYDENVLAGLIISSSPDGGEQVPEGTPISIKISKGQESFPMPDVVGMDITAAQQKLSDIGLMVSVEYALSETVDEDHVISQSIAASTPITRGEQVTIVVSTKEPLVTVPNVVGHPRSDAETALKDLEFEVNVIQSYDASVPEGYVINQNPKADSSQKKGVTVTIIVSKGPEPTPTPAPGVTPGTTPGTTPAPGTTPGTTPAPGITPGSNVTPGPGTGPIYRLTFNANGGTVSEKERQLSGNSAYGQLPSATRDYYSFDGWYTSANGGSQVSASTVISAHTTIYAHWTEKPVSDWILSDKVPAGAQILDEKWTYTLTETQESDKSELDGWTLDKKEVTGYGERKKAYEDPTGGDRKVEPVTKSYEPVTVYMYYHFDRRPARLEAELGRFGPVQGTWHEIRVNHPFEYVGTETAYDPYSGEEKTYRRYKGDPCTGYPDAAPCGETDHWYLNDSWETYEYVDVWYYQDPIYTYYFKRVTEKESTTDPSSQTGVSDVKKYVKYRAK